MAALLDSSRVAYGSCKAGEVLEGDGVSKATLKLACERGNLRLTLNAEQGRLSKLALRPEPGLACVP